jgi:DNA-binding Lrp family transcriptional regulator
LKDIEQAKLYVAGKFSPGEEKMSSKVGKKGKARVEREAREQDRNEAFQKMKEAGVITGSQFNISPKNVGYFTCAFIGLQVNLTSTRTHQEVFNKIMKIPEIVECHHVTGNYSLLAKVYCNNNEHLKKIIVENIAVNFAYVRIIYLRYVVMSFCHVNL